MIQRAPGLHRGGFTLIEVLVATAILAIILGIVFGTFFYTVNNAEEREEHASLCQRASFILNNIGQTVASACVPFAGRYPDMQEEKSVLRGTDAVDDGFDADSLSTFTTNPRFGARARPGEIALVSYETEPHKDFEGPELPLDKNNPLLLKCTVQPLLTKSDDEQAGPQWVLGIRSLNIDYFDGSEWLAEWRYENQGTLPKAVKIELTLGDSNENTFTFSTMARVHVNALLEETAAPAPQGQEQDEPEEKLEELEEEDFRPPDAVGDEPFQPAED